MAAPHPHRWPCHVRQSEPVKASATLLRRVSRQEDPNAGRPRRCARARQCGARAPMPCAPIAAWGRPRFHRQVVLRPASHRTPSAPWRYAQGIEALVSPRPARAGVSSRESPRPPSNSPWRGRVPAAEGVGMVAFCQRMPVSAIPELICTKLSKPRRPAHGPVQPIGRNVVANQMEDSRRSTSTVAAGRCASASHSATAKPAVATAAAAKSVTAKADGRLPAPVK